eukprot:TRINITY_DN8744_c0_g1_i1.p1 TRINITY_DN8744_c0_g1~~TRINITY_DN8744_c0_g1_i1.p1  ORF type:complete len:241 (+),score=35.80 TRINITY_DN8744_c0_g1_i1:98-820(+)
MLRSLVGSEMCIRDRDASSEVQSLVGQATPETDLDDMGLHAEPSFDYPSLAGDPECCLERVDPPVWMVERRVGRFHVLTQSHEGARWPRVPKLGWMLGPCWPMMAVTMALITVLGALMIGLATSGLYVGWRLLGVPAVGMVLGCYLCTAMSDPGIVPHWEHPGGEGWTFARKTGGWIPPDVGEVAYCPEGRVLIKDYDHFCVWTGTAIGGANMCWFMCFLKGVFGLLGLVVVFAQLPRAV